MQLRDYQVEAVEAVYKHLRKRNDNPAVVLPTGSGKSLIISQIAKDAVVQWRGRVLVLAHVKELLEQAVDKLQKLCPDLMVGVHSAGLKSRDILSPVIVAGIQSVYKKACELGAFDLIIVDEAHLIPPEGEGMYRSFLADAKTVNPNVRLIGFTATPFRMNSGEICGEDNLLNHVCYEIGVKELITRGYLCPLVTKAARAEADASKLHIRGGEFIASETEDLMDDEKLVKMACYEIDAFTSERKSCLVFCAGVKHAEHVAKVLSAYGGTVECVFGDTLPGLRAQYIDEFRQGKIKYLVNVNVLTTGFDAPNVDCVVLLRPTNSAGLFYQQCGRGFRLHPGKKDCLVLDFGGNVMRHGPVDTISVKSKSGGTGEAPAKKCPECLSVIHAAYQKCPDCGHEFPPPEREKHSNTATNAGIISGQVDYAEYDIDDVIYSVHTKRGADEESPRTMRIDYCTGWQQFKTEWVCPEHTGYVRGKFEEWWRRRANWQVPPPATASEAVRLAVAGALAFPLKITVKSVAGEKFDKIVGYKLGPIPEFVPEAAVPDEELDEIPF